MSQSENRNLKISPFSFSLYESMHKNAHANQLKDSWWQKNKDALIFNQTSSAGQIKNVKILYISEKIKLPKHPTARNFKLERRVE